MKIGHVLFYGVEGVLNGRNVVHIVEDDSVTINNVIDAADASNRDGGCSIPKDDVFGGRERIIMGKEGPIA